MRKIKPTRLSILFLTATISGIFAASAMAQTDFTIGTGTSTNLNWEYPSPLPDYYESSRQQFLYTAAEATAAGMTAGNITAVKWDVISLNNTGALEHFMIKIGTTTASSLSLTGWEPINTVVYGPVGYQPVSGINMFSFNSPFFWDGSSNIVVEICVGDAGNLTSDTYTYNPGVAYTIVPFNGSRTLSYDSWGNICSSNDTLRYHQIPNRRPNITFVSGTSSTTCQAPSGVALSSVTTTSANASWTAPAGVSTFQYTVDQSAFAPSGNGTPVTGTTLLIGSLTAGTSYYFHIRSECPGSTYSPWIHIPFNTISAPTGITETRVKGSLISVSPNPAAGRIDLLKTDKKPGNLTVVDLSGRILKELVVREETTTVDLTDIAAGLYFVYYSNGERSEAIKFLKL